MVEYTTIEEPEIKRSLRLIRVVLTSLPLEINVEDFFRGTRYADAENLPVRNLFLLLLLDCLRGSPYLQPHINIYE